MAPSLDHRQRGDRRSVAVDSPRAVGDHRCGCGGAARHPQGAAGAYLGHGLIRVRTNGAAELGQMKYPTGSLINTLSARLLQASLSWLHPTCALAIMLVL